MNVTIEEILGIALIGKTLASTGDPDYDTEVELPRRIEGSRLGKDSGGDVCIHIDLEGDQFVTVYDNTSITVELESTT